MSKLRMTRPLSIVHLYPTELNIYGDTGNRLVLEKRLQWRGIPYKVHMVHPGGVMPADADIVLGGGGQDASQMRVADDLMGRKKSIERLIEKGTVMLLVCGTYQLFGRRFVTSTGEQVDGLGLLPVETIAGKGRIVGNIVVDVFGIGEVVGYENHSGRTYLDAGAKALGSVIKGVGNDDNSRLEGCRVNNVFGTYMHGPVLSKNPHFADELIRLALKSRGVDVPLGTLDDRLERQAQTVAISRPR